MAYGYDIDFTSIGQENITEINRILNKINLLVNYDNTRYTIIGTKMNKTDEV